MSTYTVKGTMPTGKAHDTFGAEYYVQFNETDLSFPMWFKTAPEIGKQIDGEIQGNKFKKEKKEWNPSTQTQDSRPAATQSAPSAKPAYKDNSEGMRKGMVINNAAQYVVATATESLTPSQWAKAVTAYARALYALSELEDAPEEVPQNVQEVFGVSK